MTSTTAGSRRILVQSASPWRAKSAAVATALLALLIVLQLRDVADVAIYLALLMVVAVPIALFASVRLWGGGTWEGRIISGGLSLVGLVGQVLNLTAGLPGASALQGGIGQEAVLTTILEVATLVLLGIDVSRRPPEPDRRHPYAL